MRFVAASSADLRPIGDIVRSAQRSLAELGIDQWQDGYPSEEIIADDIAAGEGYVILADDGSVAAYGAVKVGREADYDDIRGGAWRYDGEYVVVHRLCVAEPHRRSGLASMFFACAAQIARRSGRDIIRVDTHQGNVRMLSLLDKEGFGRCGTIRCRSGVRTAFDRRVAPPRIAVREAVPDDCYIISDAVTAAFGEDLCRRLCRDASPQRIRGFFAEVAAMPATQYSFENTIVCTVDGVAAGAICGYDGARLDELRSPVLDMLRRRVLSRLDRHRPSVQRHGCRHGAAARHDRACPAVGCGMRRIVGRRRKPACRAALPPCRFLPFGYAHAARTIR